MSIKVVRSSLSRLCIVASCAGLLLASCSRLRAQCAGSPASPNTSDRPHLGHQTEKVANYGLPNDAPAGVPGKPAPNGPLVAPGLYLPPQGLVWALDSFAGKQELVRLKYKAVDLNNHAGSNFLKTQAAPFLYKPKHTVEIEGTAAELRLHEASPVFFVRNVSEGEESADESPFGLSTLSLVRLEAKSGRRVAATIAFTQITSKASRSNTSIDVVNERIPGTNWYKLTPTQPLPAGEYGWMSLPKKQNMFGGQVYDFAIDAKAPENTGAIAADR
jgi:hypothetical protein